MKSKHKGQTRKLRIDGVIEGIEGFMSGQHDSIKEEAFFVTHDDGKKAERPTIFVGAFCRTAADRLWLAKVVKVIEGIEVPR